MNHGGPNLSAVFVGVLSMDVRQVAERIARREQVGNSFNPLCILRFPERARGDSDAAIFTSFDSFLESNKDWLTFTEIQMVTDYLVAGRVYRSGGGADEPYSIERAPAGISEVRP
jgi:hypothetical protein